MNKHRIFEIVCVIALAVFIVFMTSESHYSDKTAQQVAQTLVKSFDVSELKEIDKNKIREDFSIEFDGIDSFVYYASDSVMNVDELMIIKLKKDINGDEIIEKIENRVTEKQVLFEGYAPEQSALLNSFVLKEDSSFIFYAVGEDADEAYRAFKSSVR